MALDKYVDASLVLVPSGRKAGKAYSQIPTDGDGDLSLSRASIKTEVDTSGNVVSLADNVPGLDFSLGACPYLSLDPLSTNICLYSEDFSTTWATAGGATVATDTTVSPGGSDDADTITLDGAAASRVEQSITMSTSTVYTLSVWAKVASGTKDFRLGYNDGSTTTASSDLTATTDWQRFEFTFTTSASHTGEEIRITNNVGGDPGDLIVWGAQLELGDYATGYIPTTSAAVTRQPDAFSLTDLITNGLLGATVGTMYIKGKINVEAGNASLFILSDGTTNNRIRLTQNLIQCTTAGSNANITGVFTADSDGYDDVNFAVRWNGTNAKVYLDGTAAAAGTAAFTAGAALTEFELNGKNDTSWIKEVLFYTTALSDADMITLTTP